MSGFLASLHPAVVCLIVCAAKIIEITIQSLKTCMMVKGQRLKAAGLGFAECTEQIVAYLRGRNLGYTVFEDHGSKDKMNMIFIVLARKEAGRGLADLRRECDNRLFVSVSDVSKYAGGYGLIK